jgi:hypothetical protein
MIPNDMRAQTTKYPLVEEITGTWCQWCPYGADSLEQLLGWVTEARALALHDGDSMSTTEGSAVIASFRPPGDPSAMIDRMLWLQSDGSGPYYAIYRDIWGEAASSMALTSGWMTISFTGTYDTVKRSVWATVDVTALKKLSGEYWLNFVISEDSLNYVQKLVDPDGSNARYIYPFYHMNVVRKMATTWSGVNLTSAGFSSSQKITKNVSCLNMPAAWKRNNLKLTVFVTRTDTVYFGATMVLEHDAVQQTAQMYLNDIGKYTPVTLLSFYAKEVDGNVHVTWTTERESNNRGWYLERNANLGAWEQIGFIDGHGTTQLNQTYEYTDNNVSLGGKYKYRLRQTDFDGTEKLSEVAYVIIGGLPSTTRLLQNYPNPFNPSTTITMDLASSSFVNLDVFDEMGRKVATLANGDYDAGVHFIQWSALDNTKNVLPAGTYYARLTTQNGIQNLRMTITK